MNLGFRNVDARCRAVDLTTERPTIDLSDITFFEPFALVYLGMFLRFFNARGKYFDVNLPTDTKARAYLARQNFWERFNFSAEFVAQEGRLRRFTPSTSFGDVIDIECRDLIAEEIAEAAMKILSPRKRAGMVGEVMVELVDNFVQHAQGPLAACAMQLYPNLSVVRVAIGDCGIGIRASLASTSKYAHLAAQPHGEVALKAFEPLVTRKVEGGTGLTDVRDAVRQAGGSLILSTGDGYVRVEKSRTAVGQMAFDLPGVQIELSIPT